MSLPETLEDLRRRLLDLTRRNRLLNVRDGGRATLRLVDERPEEVWRLLVDEERALTFLPVEEAPPELRPTLERAAATAADAAAGTPTTDAPAAATGPAPAPPDADLDLPPVAEGPVAARHRDRRLQTALDGKALEARLLHLAREARAHLEEQGCNVLYVALGAAEWRDAEGDVGSRAPLLFVPVALERASVATRHTIALFDDELLANPCLAELLRQTTRETLPPFQPEAEGFDVGAWLAAAAAVVRSVPGWTYRPDVTLGLFSFGKLLLWRDLDPRAWPEGRGLAEHPLVRWLAGDPTPGADLGPGAVEPASLDATAPDASFHVVDADSSQAAALAAVRAGSTLVVDGPPGTGKSQTITNLVAEALADGKRVLFVAEKAAALDVVRRRLEAAGLGDFLLELHSRKASKRAVIERLARALEAPRRDAPAASPATADELARTRARLAEVHRALHAPAGPLGLSPYEAVRALAALAGAPEAAVALDGAAAYDAAALATARDAVEVLDRRRERVPDPAAHPWRGVGRTEVPLDVARRVQEALTALPSRVDALRATARALAARLGVAAPTTGAHAAAAAATARALLAAAPGLDASTVDDVRWDAPDDAPGRLVATLSARATARAAWTTVFAPAAETGDWDAVLARRRAHGGSWLRGLRPSWRRDRRALVAASRPDAPRDDAATTAALEALVESGRRRAEAEALAAGAAPLVGAAFTGVDADVATLRRRLDAARAARALVARGEASRDAARDAASEAGRAALSAQADAVEAALAAFDAWTTAWTGLLETDDATWFGGPARAAALDALAARHAGLASDLDALHDAAAYVAARRRAEALGLSAFVAWSEGPAGTAARGRMAVAFEAQARRLALEAALGADEALRGFRGDDVEDVARRFAQADRAFLAANRARVVERCLSRRPAADAGASRETKLGLLRAQMRLKRGHLPLRRLLERAGDVVQSVTPCFLMSPGSVAHYLAPGAVAFDLVVFDEASQVEPADALGAVARARQLVLFGDERQLPPTPFFARTEAAEEGARDEVASADLESVLGLAIVRLPATHRAPLRWHYRSRDPSLVEFSNRRFYDASLVTFPGPRVGRHDLGVFLRPVPSATYRRGAGQSNPEEARAVAAAVMAHARAFAQGGGGPSLGVGAFSVAQQRAIEDELERLRREDPGSPAEAFFDEGRDEPFFVKNLETIQGDERDVILLSVGYGRDEAGRLTMNFGPLNQENGWRRLNVLVTRARARCEVFSSLRAEDLRVEPTSPRGVAALRDYLAYADRGGFDDAATEAARDAAAPFEAAVAAALRARGHVVHTGVGEGPWTVDLGVVDPDDPRRFLLGIESDGGAWRRGATVRDRDRLRGEVLARMGWRLAHVWSADWARRPKAAVDRLVALVDEARRAPRATTTPPTPAASPAPASAASPVAAPPSPPAPTVAAEPVAPYGVATRRPAVPEASRAATPPPGTGDAFVPYPRRDARPWGAPDALTNARPDRVAGWVAAIVEREGPVHLEEALRVLAASFGTRASPRAREAFAAGLLHATQGGRVERRGDFLWRAGATSPEVRRRDADCPVTDPDLVAPEEWEAATARTLALEFGASREGLVAATVRRLGYERTGPRLRAAVEASIDRLLATGTIVRDARGDLAPGHGT
ncbi:MAG: DUF4011 domain-containing protein [Planctomycetes bacterium]|nr:DUF4011 domain-containing protein [Planctomycetota bacterium]